MRKLFTRVYGSSEKSWKWKMAMRMRPATMHSRTRRPTTKYGMQQTVLNRPCSAAESIKNGLVNKMFFFWCAKQLAQQAYITQYAQDALKFWSKPATNGITNRTALTRSDRTFSGLEDAVEPRNHDAVLRLEGIVQHANHPDDGLLADERRHLRIVRKQKPENNRNAVRLGLRFRKFTKKPFLIFNLFRRSQWLLNYQLRRENNNWILFRHVGASKNAGRQTDWQVWRWVIDRACRLARRLATRLHKSTETAR